MRNAFSITLVVALRPAQRAAPTKKVLSYEIQAGKDKPNVGWRR